MTKATIVKLQGLNSVRGTKDLTSTNVLDRTKKLSGEAIRDNFGRSEYFNGKFSELGISEQQAISNSRMMDRLILEMNDGNKAEVYDKIREEIVKQYKELGDRANGKGADFPVELSDEQINSIIEAHKENGKLGKLTKSQLKIKVGILKNTIGDFLLIRFLLESGFCGSMDVIDRFLGGKLPIVVDQMKKLVNYRTLEQNSNYSIGDYVLIPRTNGTPCLAIITNFDPRLQEYEVTRKEKDWNPSSRGKLVGKSVICYKRLKKEDIDKANSLLHRCKNVLEGHIGDYELGENVLIPRNGGTPFLAKIKQFSVERGFKVEWIEKGEIIHKWVDGSELDNLNKSMVEKCKMFFEGNISINKNNFDAGNYAVGDYTLVPGAEYLPLSIITGYDQENGEYTLDRISYNGQKCQKKVTRKDLIDVNKCLFRAVKGPKYGDYQLNQNVVIPRTYGTPSVGKITSYNPVRNEFIVEWRQGNTLASKAVSYSDVDKFNRGIIELRS